MRPYQRSVAVVPIAAIAIGVGPVPAQVWSRPARDQADRGDRHDRAQRDACDDPAIVRPARPWPGEHVAAAWAVEARPDAWSHEARSRAPILYRCNDAAGLA